MLFIDPHIHMTARTTYDYERMAAAGIIAIIEPAFWGSRAPRWAAISTTCPAW